MKYDQKIKEKQKEVNMERSTSALRTEVQTAYTIYDELRPIPSPRGCYIYILSEAMDGLPEMVLYNSAISSWRVQIQ